MVFFEKSQPAPSCLAIEAEKESGDYKCGAVLSCLSDDFCNKCYICEYVAPSTINVEHFIPHQGDKELKFNWDNLFWACAHCNNTKLARYQPLLNCTIEAHQVETTLRYWMKPFPHEMVQIDIVEDNEMAQQTQNLLLAVYNGTTPLKKIESAYIRNKLLQEIRDFQQQLIEYFDVTNTEEDQQFYRRKIRRHLNKASAFTAFKRWIIRDNERLLEEFGAYLND